MPASVQNSVTARTDSAGAPLGKPELGKPEAIRTATGKNEPAGPDRIVMPDVPNVTSPVAVPPAAEPLPPELAVTAESAPRSTWRKRLILAAVLLAGLGVGGSYGRDWVLNGRFLVSTNDAFVKTDMTILGAKISGYVAALPVAENGAVKAGDVILKLDDGDYLLAVQAATGRVATQQAVIEGTGQQIEAQTAEIAAADARVAEAVAGTNNANATLARIQKLVGNAVASRQSLDDAVQKRDAANASLAQMKASVVAAKAQTGVLSAKRVEGERLLAELKTAVAKAKRDLSFTEIRAPFDGIVANRAVEVGQFVQGGSRLMALVPANAAYVEANFKETEIAELHPGQKVTISVDAYAGKIFAGTVDSLAPASGSEFSLLPPENATGNFTKITQRVPVKIKVARALAPLLRPGLSVYVTVDSRDAGSGGV